jgi:small-conductance mechanosensitive channel
VRWEFASVIKLNNTCARGLRFFAKPVPAFLLAVALSASSVGASPIPSLSPVGRTSDRAAIEAGARGSDSPAELSETIEEKLSQTRQKLAAVEFQNESAGTNLPKGITLESLAARRMLLSRLAMLYDQQLSNASELKAAKERRAGLDIEAKAWTRFTEPPPYSILLADQLREEIQSEQLKIKSCRAAFATLEQLVAENRGILEEAEERIRQLDEKLEGAIQAGGSGTLSEQRELERLRSQVASATLKLLESEKMLREEVLAGSRTRVEWRQRQLLLAEPGATFTSEDLRKVMARIDEESRQLETELGDARRQADDALSQWDAARKANPDGSAPASPQLKATLESREAQLKTAQSAVRVLRLMLETENVERAMWEMRFEAHNSRRAATLRESERRLKLLTRRIDLWKDFLNQEMAASPSQLQMQETRVRSLARDSELLPLAQQHLTALRERDRMFARLLRRIEQVQRLDQRWAEALLAAGRQLPFVDRVQNLFTDAGSFARKLWQFELLSAEDTIVVEGQKITGRRSITLGKIAMAAVILCAGIWVTGLVTRFGERVSIRRFKLEPNQARLIRRWLRALLIVCLVMFSLVSVKIPLTVFAFAGGALAIGLGFGMQTLLKNFVSGLILLFERPFKVGDVLEIGQQRGIVTEIGLRSSVLQLWDGTETLIPNSSLLENNVSNWTYSNRKVRFCVTVGVAYGSDTRRVIQLLTEAAQRHGVIEKEPPPQVLFTDFGESSLTFELRYWVDVLKANAAQVGSDLRQMIAGSFAENGIVIAFPQRDVRLEAIRPLPVEIMNTPGSKLAVRPEESL